MMFTCWTSTEIQILKTQWTAGISAGVIATTLQRTRNAVLGKLDRLQLRRSSYPVRAKKRRKKITFIRARSQMTFGSDIEVVHYYEQTNTRPRTSNSKTLIELENHHCRFPHGDPHQPDFFFCGEPSADLAAGRPYCIKHSRMRYA
jgi:GcrA cell cycle regulator